MKLCDQCSSGRSIKDTHSSYSYKLCCCFLVWDFGLFPPLCHPLQHSNNLRRKQHFSKQDLTFCNMTRWHVEFKISYCLFYSSQHSAAHMGKNTVTSCNSVLDLPNSEQNKSQKWWWMVKQDFASRAQSTTYQAMFLEEKRSLWTNQSFSCIVFIDFFFLTNKPNEAFMVIYSTVKRWAAAQFSEQVTSFN